jgi:hypothetical protein
MVDEYLERACGVVGDKVDVPARRRQNGAPGTSASQVSGVAGRRSVKTPSALARERTSGEQAAAYPSGYWGFSAFHRIAMRIRL